MGLSKNSVCNQEEIFDSWIQRQSHVSRNKENISSQLRKIEPDAKKNDPITQNNTFSRTS